MCDLLFFVRKNKLRRAKRNEIVGNIFFDKWNIEQEIFFLPSIRDLWWAGTAWYPQGDELHELQNLVLKLVCWKLL